MKNILTVIIAVVMLNACATKKHYYSEQEHVVASDSTVKDSTTRVQIQTLQAHVDSMMQSLKQQVSISQITMQQEQERIEETWTEYVDSLGRTVRQQQRVTNRTASQQDERTEERTEEQMMLHVDRMLAQHDSIWQQEINTLKAMYNSRENSKSEKQTYTELSLFAKVKFTLLGVIAGIILILVARMKGWMK